MNNKNYRIASDVLSNCEMLSDKEIHNNLIENGLSEKETKFYVNQRSKILMDPFAELKKFKGE